MKESLSFTSSLTVEIKQDNIRGALEKVEFYNRVSQSDREADFSLKCATKCLIEVQLLLCKGLNENRNVVSSTEDIFRLAKKCFNTIELSEWDISNSHLLSCAYYLIKYFLSKDDLSFCNYVCCTLQRWLALNSTQLKDSEKKILAQSICPCLTYYLHSIDLNKFLEASGNNLKLVFDSCKLPCALQPNDEIVLQKSLLVLRSLIIKINTSNIELNDSMHIDCVMSVVKTFRSAGNSDASAATFMAYLEMLGACVFYIANKKYYQELLNILKLVEASKQIFPHKDCTLCLDFCTSVITLVLVDLGLLDGSFSNLCSRSCNSLEQLSSKNIELMPWAIVFLYKTSERFSFEFKKRDSTFSTLAGTACKIQKTIIDSATPKSDDILTKLNVFINSIILSKVINISKESSNSEDFLVFIFEFLEKVTDYSLRLLEYDHENGCVLKDHCKSLVERIMFLIRPYCTANMFDRAFKLTFSFIERLVCLGCDSSCHLSHKNKTFTFKVASLCSKKTGNVGSFVDAIVAAVCKGWSKELSSSVDEMFGHLADIKNCEECCGADKSSTFFELLDKRKTVLTEKWNVTASVLSEIKCTSVVLSELNAYRKLLLTSQGDFMLKVFKNLLKLNPSILEAAKGLVFVLDLSTRIAIDVGKFEKERLKIQENLRKQVKESGDFESLLLFGSLLHYNTLFKIYAMRKTIQVKAVKWKAKEAPPTLNETGMFSDPNETCAGPVAAAASELTFAKQQPLVDELDQSYNYLKAAFQKMEADCNGLDAYLDITCSTIKLTAQLYNLYYFQEKATDAWILLYSYGQKFSHQNMRITAVSNLLKLEVQFDKRWIDDAIEIAGSLPESTSERQLLYICLAKSCIKSSQISDAVSYLTKVGTQFRNEKIHTNYLLTLGQVLLIPESPALWKGAGPASAIYYLDKAFRHLYHQINTDNWVGFIDHCTLEETFLDTLMCLKSFYSSLLMPRLTYYYLTEQSSVVQKLAVPLRVADVLMSLAWTDVWVHRKDDCDLKIASLMAILGLDAKPPKAGRLKEAAAAVKSPKAAKPKGKGLSLADDDSVMDLMVTSSSWSTQLSPVLGGGRKEAGWSQIVLHAADCACLSCRTPKLLQLTLDLLMLQAASCCIRKQSSQATMYFHDALDYIQFLRGKDISDEWLAGRQVALYYFYNEMLISHKNFKAAELGVRQISKLAVSIGCSNEIYGVTDHHISTQKNNLIFYDLKNRWKKRKEEKAQAKLPTKQRLAVSNVQSIANEKTPAKTSAVVLPSACLLSTSKTTNLPEYDKRNLLVSAKTLDFSSCSDDDDVVDSTFVEKENNFASPILAKQRLKQRNMLPAFVSQVPKPVATTTKTSNARDKLNSKVQKNDTKEKVTSKVQNSKMAPPVAAKPLKEKNDVKDRTTTKPRSRFEICSDPPASSSSRSGSSAVVKEVKPKKTETLKPDKPKRAVRAVRK